MGESPGQFHERMLVIRSQTGDKHALAELVDCYQPRLSYFVWKMLENPEKVDDVLQDTWLAVFRGLPKLKDATAFPAWVYRIARDYVFRELRRIKGVSTMPLHEVEPIADTKNETEFDRHDVALVHECLNELSRDHREVLLLRFMQALSYEEMAAVAGCEVGTVRSRLHYAKVALKRAIEGRRDHE
jgi:RNA polymerase sigma-70 factor, ECF subfamily